jgi:hypothetical protein
MVAATAHARAPLKDRERDRFMKLLSRANLMERQIPDV